MYSRRVCIGMGRPGNVPRTARGVLLSAPSPSPESSHCCPSDGGGKTYILQTLDVIERGITLIFIPLLTLGIPTSNTTAILLGAFQNYGIQPGPQLFTSSSALVWALIASLYIGNVMLLVLNLPLIGLWVKLLKVPKPQLYAGILIFATVGAYGMRQSAFDLFLLYAIGVLGLVMRRYSFPTAPVVVGMILGPLAEAQLRNAMSIGEGSAMVFLQRPMSLTLLVVVVAVLVVPRLLKKRTPALG